MYQNEESDDYVIPSSFIEEKRRQIVNNYQYSQEGFIDNLYAQYNFQFYKHPINSPGNDINKKPSLKSTIQFPDSSYPQPNLSAQLRHNSGITPQEIAQSQRLKRISSLIRCSNLKQKAVVDKMADYEKNVMYREKRKLNNRIKRGQTILQYEDQFEYTDIINLDAESRDSTMKGVTYVNNRKAQLNERREEAEPQDCEENKSFGKTYNLVPFQQAYKNKRALFQMNRPIHEKNTYRFNVLWWDKQKKVQNPNRKHQSRASEKKMDDQWLEPQVAKQLKKILKPLRRHKLMSARCAPLAQFTPETMLERDGIKDGKMLDSSESEDQIETFKLYDKKARQQTNPPNAIHLQEEPKRRSRVSRKSSNRGQNSVKSGNRKSQNQNLPNYLFQNDEIDNKLKRALRKLHDQDWEEDKLFTKGTDQEKPIVLE